MTGGGGGAGKGSADSYGGNAFAQNGSYYSNPILLTLPSKGNDSMGSDYSNVNN